MTREFIVLGHEVVSGNFSRIPGSLMVLASRSGALTSVVSAMLSPLGLATAGLAGAGIAVDDTDPANPVVASTLQQATLFVQFDASGNYGYYIPLNYCVTETISSPGQSFIPTPNICSSTRKTKSFETHRLQCTVTC